MSNLVIMARESANFAQETFKLLDQKLNDAKKNHEFLKKRKTDWEYAFCMNGFYFSGPAFIAVAEFSSEDGDIYAIMAPEYLEERQEKVFEYFLRKISQEQIIVFSKKDYDAIQKFNISKLDVKLFK